MKAEQRTQLEREYHESEDQARGASCLIARVYGSGIFEEAETYQLDSLGDIRGAHVLDYGCGGGWSSARLRARGARVTGLDLSQTRLREAQGHLARAKDVPPFGLLQCDAQRLPFGDGAFDAILGKGILHHLELGLAVPEIRRVLRPGGKAAFLEPLIHNPLLQAYRRLTPHLRSPTERALSMRDVRWVGAQFHQWEHCEFCLLIVFPALLGAVVSHARLWAAMRGWLQRVDRALIHAVPAIGRYCWETAILVER
jgi:SAM-dependent methyltransferase